MNFPSTEVAFVFSSCPKTEGFLLRNYMKSFTRDVTFFIAFSWHLFHWPLFTRTLKPCVLVVTVRYAQIFFSVPRHYRPNFVDWRENEIFTRYLLPLGGIVFGVGERRKVLQNLTSIRSCSLQIINSRPNAFSQSKSPSFLLSLYIFDPGAFLLL